MCSALEIINHGEVHAPLSQVLFKHQLPHLMNYEITTRTRIINAAFSSDDSGVEILDLDFFTKRQGSFKAREKSYRFYYAPSEKQGTDMEFIERKLKEEGFEEELDTIVPRSA